MKSSSLLGHAVELIGLLSGSGNHPADARVGRFFRERRYLGSRDRKVVGGKLFRVSLSLSMEGQTARIDDLKLLGDYFMHPEESVEGLESSLMEAFNSGQDLTAAVTRYIDRENASIYGGGPVDIAGAVLDAVNDALSKATQGNT